MTVHGLSDDHAEIIRNVLQPFATQIDRVGLFGSRATGTHRPDSDIDLILYGALQEADVARIITRFSESLLPFTVDVHAYHLISYPPLKAHIDAVMRPLDVLPKS